MSKATVVLCKMCRDGDGQWNAELNKTVPKTDGDWVSQRTEMIETRTLDGSVWWLCPVCDAPAQYVGAT